MRDECTLKDLKECGSFFKLFEHEIYNININIYIRILTAGRAGSNNCSRAKTKRWIMNKYDNTDWSVTFSSSCSHCHLFFSWRVCDAEGWVLQHTRRGDKWVFKTPVDWLVRDYTDRSVDWWFWDILGDYTAQYIGDCHNPVWESCLPAIKRWQRVLNTGAPPKIYRYWLLETTCQHMKNGLPRDDCPARPGDLVIFHVHFWWMVGGPNLQKHTNPTWKAAAMPWVNDVQWRPQIL